MQAFTGSSLATQRGGLSLGSATSSSEKRLRLLSRRDSTSSPASERPSQKERQTRLRKSLRGNSMRLQPKLNLRNGLMLSLPMNLFGLLALVRLLPRSRSTRFTLGSGSIWLSTSLLLLRVSELYTEEVFLKRTAWNLLKSKTLMGSSLEVPRLNRASSILSIAQHKNIDS